MGFTELSINWLDGTNLIGENGVQNMCTDICGNIFCTTNDQIIYLEYNNSSSPSWNGSLLWTTPINNDINGICVDNLGYIYCTTGSDTYIKGSGVFRISISEPTKYTYVAYNAGGNLVEQAMIWPRGIAYYENHLYIAMHEMSFIGIINAITLSSDMLYPNFNFIEKVYGCTGLSIQTNFSNQNTIPGKGGDGQGSGGAGNLQTYYMAVLFISCQVALIDICVYGYWLTQGFNYNGSWATNLVYASPGLGYETWAYQNPNNVSGSTWSQGRGGYAITTAGGQYFYINNYNNNFIYTMETGYQGQVITTGPIGSPIEVYPTSTTALAYNPVVYGVIFASLEPTAQGGIPTGIYSLSG